MTKQEMASYLASLVTIMQDRDTAGGIGRGRWLGAEYTRIYDMFKQVVEQENANENDPRRDQTGADDAQSERGGSLSPRR